MRPRYTDIVKTLESLDFESLVRAAVACGLEAAAVLDVDGKSLAAAGVLDETELRAIAAVVANYMRSPDHLTQMLDGEVLESSLDERLIEIAIAARCVFVVTVPSRQLRVLRFASDFRSAVERVISEARSDFSGARSLQAGSGGSSSGPAQLPLVEWGVTVRRKPNVVSDEVVK